MRPVEGTRCGVPGALDDDLDVVDLRDHIESLGRHQLPPVLVALLICREVIRNADGTHTIDGVMNQFTFEPGVSEATIGGLSLFAQLSVETPGRYQFRATLVRPDLTEVPLSSVTAADDVDDPLTGLMWISELPGFRFLRRRGAHRYDIRLYVNDEAVGTTPLYIVGDPDEGSASREA